MQLPLDTEQLLAALILALPEILDSRNLQGRKHPLTVCYVGARRSPHGRIRKPYLALGTDYREEGFTHLAAHQNRRLKQVLQQHAWGRDCVPEQFVMISELGWLRDVRKVLVGIEIHLPVTNHDRAWATARLEA